jgi:twinkle protein
MSKIIEFSPGFSFSQHRSKLADARGANVFNPEKLAEETREFFAKGPGPHGLRWPWHARQQDFAFAPGELTVLAADGGVGKTTLVSQIALSLSSAVKVGIISVEETSVRTVARLNQQYSLAMVPSEEQQRDFLENGVSDNVWIFEVPNAMTPDSAYGAIWAMVDKGCEFVVVDNMQSCGCKTDSDQERDFINELNAICLATGIHILLCHHVRKTGGDADNPRPTRDRVKGNGAITQLAFNVLLLWRNYERAKLRHAEEAGHGHDLSPDERKVLDNEPDLELVVSKQRNGPDHWTLPLWDGNGLTFKDERFGQDRKLGRALEI